MVIIIETSGVKLLSYILFSKGDSSGQNHFFLLFKKKNQQGNYTYLYESRNSKPQKADLLILLAKEMLGDHSR